MLRRIRALSRVPVIMLAARGEEVDRIVGWRWGADDYLAKPFSPRELVWPVSARCCAARPVRAAAARRARSMWGPLRLDLRAARARQPSTI